MGDGEGVMGDGVMGDGEHMFECILEYQRLTADKRTCIWSSIY